MFFSLSPFAPENLVSRDRVGRPVSLLVLRTQAEPGADSSNSSRFPRRRPHIPSTAIGWVPSLSGHATAHRWRSHTYYQESTGGGRPGSSEVPRNPVTRWDVSSIPANGIFLTKANSYARSKTKNPRSKIGRFRSGKIVFVPGTKTILCEIEKSAGFYLRG